MMSTSIKPCNIHNKSNKVFLNDCLSNTVIEVILNENPLILLISILNHYD